MNPSNSSKSTRHHGRMHTRLRPRMRNRMKYLAASATLALLISFSLVIYFQIAQVKPALAASNGDYRAVASGNWNSNSTWQKYSGGNWNAATSPPTSSDGTITIQSTYTVTVTANVTVDQVVIEAAGQVAVNSGITLTVANGAGTDMAISGTLRCSGNISFSGASVMIQNGGTYQHNRDGGTLPSFTWNTGSTCEVTGSITTVPGGMNQTFQNFKWNCPGQTGNLDFNAAPLNVLGDITVASTGTGNFTWDFQGNGNTLIVGGNFYVTGGTAYTCSNGATTVSIAGNLVITGGTYAFNQWGATAYGNTSTNMYIGGNLAVSGGTLDLSQYSGNNTAKGVGDLYLSGNLNVSGTGLITETGNAKGRIFFAGNTIQTFSTNNQITNIVDYVVNPGAILRTNNNVLTDDGSFTLMAGGGLMIGSSDGITQTAMAGNVQVTGTRSYSTGADYTYEGTAAQVSGDGLPSQVRNLTLNNPNNCTLSASTSASGTMTFTTGIWIATNDTLTLGISTSVSGTLSRTNGHVYGFFRRWQAATTASNILFPVGTLNSYNGANFSFTTAPTTGGSIVSTFIPTNPGTAGLPVIDAGDNCNTIGYGYWSFGAANSFSGGVYDVNVYANGFPGISDYTKLHLLRRTNGSSNWGISGTHSAGSGSNAAPVVNRMAMNSLGHYGISSGTMNVLPIELISFDAKAEGNSVKFIWITAAEVNNDFFTIERSSDGRNFEEILRKSGGGNSSKRLVYTALDDAPLNGMNYYRLKQTDYDGKYEYFPVKAVSFNTSSAGESITLDNISPNPFRDNFKVTFKSSGQSPVEIQIMNNSGQLVYKETIIPEKGFNSFSFTDNSNLASGIYFVNIISNGEKVTKKLIKQS